MSSAELVIYFGDQVTLDDGGIGHVRFIGEVVGKKGTLYGIELTSGKGRNNGSLEGVTYFSVKDNAQLTGRLVTKNKITKTTRTKQSTKFTIGESVIVKGVQGGVITYVGIPAFASFKKVHYGIELHEAKGDNDGVKGGHKYFTCGPKHGVFTNNEVDLMTVEEFENNMKMNEKSQITEKNFDDIRTQSTQKETVDKNNDTANTQTKIKTKNKQTQSTKKKITRNRSLTTKQKSPTIKSASSKASTPQNISKHTKQKTEKLLGAPNPDTRSQRHVFQLFVQEITPIVESSSPLPIPNPLINTAQAQANAPEIDVDIDEEKCDKPRTSEWTSPKLTSNSKMLEYGFGIERQTENPTYEKNEILSFLCKRYKVKKQVNQHFIHPGTLAETFLLFKTGWSVEKVESSVNHVGRVTAIICEIIHENEPLKNVEVNQQGFGLEIKTKVVHL
ncbi:hypothetical protein RFI_00648 [Reticulomyxa filosa]|uniref:CAP-Gly domain-containing protein n=1 Tax=Reticulomyxa filosa TaxID=46433 RepID=X6PEA6_RETFI|nr:hypothetical protein RFI_00648 [Reticulomyxa filosa]|eukprot:ETO36423.1 hypothetical protein RFI_00648 [Reticulomyxa filosa]